MKKILASIGIGNATVDTVLPSTLHDYQTRSQPGVTEIKPPSFAIRRLEPVEVAVI